MKAIPLTLSLPPPRRCRQPRTRAFGFQAVAELVASNFPRCRVADVGGGDGMLTRELRRLGFSAFNLDPQAKGPHALRRCFEPGFDRNWPLLVGVHPHGATLDLAMAAVHSRVVVIPCCELWPGRVERHVRALWSKLKVPWVEHRLGLGAQDRVFLSLATAISAAGGNFP